MEEKALFDEPDAGSGKEKDFWGEICDDPKGDGARNKDKEEISEAEKEEIRNQMLQSIRCGDLSNTGAIGMWYVLPKGIFDTKEIKEEGKKLLKKRLSEYLECEGDAEFEKAAGFLKDIEFLRNKLEISQDCQDLQAKAKQVIFKNIDLGLDYSRKIGRIYGFSESFFESSEFRKEIIKTVRLMDVLELILKDGSYQTARELQKGVNIPDNQINTPYTGGEAQEKIDEIAAAVKYIVNNGDFGDLIGIESDYFNFKKISGLPKIKEIIRQRMEDVLSVLSGKIGSSLDKSNLTEELSLLMDNTDYLKADLELRKWAENAMIAKLSQGELDVMEDIKNVFDLADLYNSNEFQRRAKSLLNSRFWKYVRHGTDIYLQGLEEVREVFDLRGVLKLDDNSRKEVIAAVKEMLMSIKDANDVNKAVRFIDDIEKECDIGTGMFSMADLKQTAEASIKEGMKACKLLTSHVGSLQRLTNEFGVEIKTEDFEEEVKSAIRNHLEAGFLGLGEIGKIRKMFEIPIEYYESDGFVNIVKKVIGIYKSNGITEGIIMIRDIFPEVGEIVKISEDAILEMPEFKDIKESLSKENYPSDCGSVILFRKMAGINWKLTLPLLKYFGLEDIKRFVSGGLSLQAANEIHDLIMENSVSSDAVQIFTLDEIGYLMRNGGREPLKMAFRNGFSASEIKRFPFLISTLANK